MRCHSDVSVCLTLLLCNEIFRFALNVCCLPGIVNYQRKFGLSGNLLFVYSFFSYLPFVKPLLLKVYDELQWFRGYLLLAATPVWD